MSVWTKAEVDLLCDRYPAIGVKGCARLFPDKSIVQVRKKVENMKLKLKHGKNSQWSGQEDSIVLRLYHDKGAKALQKLLPGRTLDGIMARARTLKVSRTHQTKNERVPESETFAHIWRKAEDCDPPCIGVRCVWDLAYE